MNTEALTESAAPAETMTPIPVPLPPGLPDPKADRGDGFTNDCPFAKETVALFKQIVRQALAEHAAANPVAVKVLPAPAAAPETASTAAPETKPPVDQVKPATTATEPPTMGGPAPQHLSLGS